MVIEVLSSLASAGILGTTYIYQKGGANDQTKIERICLNSGLFVREGDYQKTIRLHRKVKTKKYVEYVYQIPLGLSFEHFIKKKNVIEDGLNNKRSIFDVSFEDIKSIDFRRNLIAQIQELIKKKKTLRKEVDLLFDGMLKIRVYKENLSEEVFFSESFWGNCKGWQIPLGETKNEFINHDMSHGHITLAGATRKGKTVLLKLIITSLIHCQPINTKLTLIDLKGGLAFTRFKDAKQVLSVASNAKEALDALKKIQKEMYDRQRLFEQKGYEDGKEAGLSERHFIVVDEAAQLSPNVVTDKEVKRLATECDFILSEIARIGAGLHYHLIYCSQYPTANVMNNQIKQNCDTVITYKLRDAVASRVVLDESGAEKLQFPGRAIYKTPDGVEIVQTPFITNEVIDKTVQPHLVIKPKKEDQHEEHNQEATKGRADTLIIEKA